MKLDEKKFIEEIERLAKDILSAGNANPSQVKNNAQCILSMCTSVDTGTELLTMSAWGASVRPLSGIISETEEPCDMFESAIEEQIGGRE